MKESKAARVERIKRQKDGLDVLNDIYRYAKADIPVDPEDIDRLKWYGLYTQNKTLQPKYDQTQYFMLRVKIEKGVLNKDQIKTLGEIAVKYARNSADFTTRQDLQFHWIKMADLPDIFEQLQKTGLTTCMAAGDVVRNTVTCPISGRAEEEIADVSDVVDEINTLFCKNREFSNLPRKFKIGVSGCAQHCMPHEIQDLSFVAVKRENGVEFALFAGGGLASNRRFADFLGYVQKDDIVPLTKATVAIFRDFGNREKRNRARLGHLIKEWGVHKFKETLEKNSGVRIKDGKIFEVSPAKMRHHCGIFSSKNSDTSHIGCALFGGKMGGDRLLQLYSLLEKYEINEIRTTTKQNFIILDVPKEAVNRVCEELEKMKINPYPSAFRTRTTACTGLDFCKFAISETKSLAEEIALYLENRFPAFGEPVNISVNGCPNSCAHPCIADIGLSGATFTRGEKKVRGFELLVGGKLEGKSSRFSKRTGILLTHEEIPGFIEKLITSYQKSGFKSFGEYLASESFDIEFAV
ncbi:nitrite/sulfite reductase [Nitrosophilus alvini]|uniref:nitrite/sulfite reductase n=1 Tax=Nitrosophilus alvini TaxID=2714855 RepID=UPI00190C0794|nr:nitrite/sulfite reductase [Nitrosophilus alvini]